MCKTPIIVMLFAIGVVIASNPFKIRMHTERYSMESLKKLDDPYADCYQCYALSASPALAILPNLTHDSSIMHTCEALCDALAKVSGSPRDQIYCNLTCTALGYEEFVQEIDSGDFDKVSYCTIGGLCKGNTVIRSFSDRLSRGILLFLCLLFSEWSRRC